MTDLRCWQVGIQYLCRMTKHVVIIGGGASGFFCAIQAATCYPEAQITLLEKHSQVLQKVKVSGGGRCNVTHTCSRLSDFLNNYPRGSKFLKKAFAHFGPQDTVQWFEQRGVKLNTEADGRMFPHSNQSQEIINLLLREAELKKIQVRLKSPVTGLRRENNFWVVEIGQQQLKADAVFVATGGMNQAAHYGWLKQLGHTVIDPIPSLFTFNIPDTGLHALSGLSVDEAEVRISGSGLQARGPLLITHWGLSGPAVLRLSAFGAEYLFSKQYRAEVMINWLAEAEHALRARWPQIRQEKSQTLLGTKNPFSLPQRLWLYLLYHAGISEDTRWSELPAKAQNKLIHMLCSQTLSLQGKTTFKEEFVICGGVDLQEIHPETMESKLLPGLFFGGEVMHVDGVTGGFNFQHAWTSAYLAGSAILKT